MKFRQLVFVPLVLTSVMIAITAAIRQERNSDFINLTFVFHQPKYVPGDTVYFSGYLFSPEAELSFSKQMVSLKLLGADKQVILHKRIGFNDHISAGQFVIPEATAPGIYLLVAYLEKESSTNEELIPFSKEFIIAGKHLFEAGINNDLPSNSESSQPLDIILGHNEFGTRKEVKLEIKMKPENSINRKATVSVAVFKEELFALTDGSRCTSVFNLQSGTGLLSQQRGQATASPFFFKGKAILKSSGAPVPDLTRITFYLNRNDFVYPVTTRKDGHFVFPLFMNFGDEEVYYSMTSKGVPLKDAIIVLDEQKLQTSIPVSGVMEASDAYAAYAHQKTTILKSYQYYIDRLGKGKSDVEPREFTDNDIEVDLRKYESFTSMAEVLMNVVPMVKIRGQSDGVRVFLESKATYANEDPLFIIDGLMTNNTGYILKLVPDQVTKIGVLRTKQTLARFGDLGVNGIIALETSIPNHDIKLERTERSLMITGISQPKEFIGVKPSAEGTNSKTPDLRASLYWNPQVELLETQAKTVSFFTSDDSGYYIIQIFGTHGNQSPFVQRSRFKVTAR